MSVPFRGVLTLCDLEIVSSFCPKPPCLQKGPILGCPTGCCAAGAGGISRALAEVAIGAGLRGLAVRKPTTRVSHLRADANITEGREQAARVGHKAWQAQKNLLCFRRRGWKSGCRISSIDFFFFFFSFFPGGLIQHLPM